jgi:HlyD family secretion protein
MKKHKKLIISLIVLCLAAAALLCVFFLKHRSGHSGSSDSDVIDDYGSDDTIAGKTLYAGVIEPEQSYNINLDSDRTVESIDVKAGDTVTAGQKLFTYQSKDYSLQVQQDQLEIQGYADTIKSCQAQITDLTKQKAAASADMKLQYDSQIQDLTSQMKQAKLDQQTKQAEIDSLNKKISSSTVTSPIDGIVSKVATGSASSDGSFITILSDTTFRIKATVDELNVGSLKEGMAAKITTRVNDKEYTGKITKIDTKSTADNGNTGTDSSDSENSNTPASKYYFYVSIDNPDGLIVGQHVFVEPESEDSSEEMDANTEDSEGTTEGSTSEGTAADENTDGTEVKQ